MRLVFLWVTCGAQQLKAFTHPRRNLARACTRYPNNSSCIFWPVVFLCRVMLQSTVLGTIPSKMLTHNVNCAFESAQPRLRMCVAALEFRLAAGCAGQASVSSRAATRISISSAAFPMGALAMAGRFHGPPPPLLVCASYAGGLPTAARL